MKIISYSLFGYGKGKHESCFEFDSYLRGLMLNVRLARLLYPDWVVRIHMDDATFEAYRRFWSNLKCVQIVRCPDAPLTKAMLWRMLPVFDPSVTAVICRDLDSPLTYREAQAVYQWMESPKQAHAINDSISHCIPMLGGMVGFKTEFFTDYTGFENWEQMVGVMEGYERKGADQDFLNRFIYPCFSNTGHSSIMHHYFLGYQPKSLDGCYTCSCREAHV